MKGGRIQADWTSYRMNRDVEREQRSKGLARVREVGFLSDAEDRGYNRDTSTRVYAVSQ